MSIIWGRCTDIWEHTNNMYLGQRQTIYSNIITGRSMATRLQTFIFIQHIINGNQVYMIYFEHGRLLICKHNSLTFSISDLCSLISSSFVSFIPFNSITFKHKRESQKNRFHKIHDHSLSLLTSFVFILSCSSRVALIAYRNKHKD